MLKINFLGDISFNNRIEKYLLENKNIFERVLSFFNNSDFNIGNLECLAVGSEGENKLKKPRLKTSPEIFKYLKYLNIKIVTLANNHVYDNLDSGFKITIEHLSKNGIKYLGAYLIDTENYNEIKIIEKNNIKIALLNYVTEDTNPCKPDKSNICVNYFNENTVLKLIKEIKNKVNHIIVLIHWGGRVEGCSLPEPKQIKIAHKLIESGVSIIIGHHPHVIQPYEKYKNGYIFYSLGNFCFDDILSDNVLHPLSDRKKIGLIVSCSFTKHKIICNTFFIKNNIKDFSIQGNYFWFSYFNLIFNYFYEIYWPIYSHYHKFILPIWEHFNRRDINIKQKIIRLFMYLIRKMKEYYYDVKINSSN